VLPCTMQGNAYLYSRACLYSKLVSIECVLVWYWGVQKVSKGAQVQRWAAVNLSRVHEAQFREFCTSLAYMCNTTGLVQRMTSP